MADSPINPDQEPDDELTPEQQEAELHFERKELMVKLKTEIFALWSRNKEDDYHIGEKLFLLQQELAKPGYGTFLEAVDELDIPQNTAYRKIRNYKRIEALWEAGYDTSYWPVRSRPYRNGKDNFPVEDLDEQDLAARQAAADRKQAEIDEIINAEAEKIARAKTEQKGRVSRLNVSLLLSEKQREKFKAVWKKKGEKVRSRIVYKAVMGAGTNSK